MRKKKLVMDTVIDLDPVQKMYKTAATRHQYLHPRSREFQDQVALHMMENFDGRLLTKKDNVYNYIRFYFRRPKTVKRKYPNIKPDIDNLEKALYDGITQSGVFWEDDSLVVGHDSMMLYDDHGYIIFRSWVIS